MRTAITVGAPLVLLAAAAFLAQDGRQAERTDAEAEIRAAVANYANSIYLGQPELLAESVRHDMRKVGFFRPENSDFRPMSSMTYDELVNLAKTYKASGKVPADAKFEVTVLDVADQTAAAKVTAFWGQDYFHLAKFEGKWMIVNIIWQSPTK